MIARRCHSLPVVRRGEGNRSAGPSVRGTTVPDGDSDGDDEQALIEEDQWSESDHWFTICFWGIPREVSQETFQEVMETMGSVEAVTIDVDEAGRSLGRGEMVFNSIQGVRALRSKTRLTEAMFPDFICGPIKGSRAEGVPDGLSRPKPTGPRRTRAQEGEGGC